MFLKINDQGVHPVDPWKSEVLSWHFSPSFSHHCFVIFGSPSRKTCSNSSFEQIQNGLYCSRQQTSKTTYTKLQLLTQCDRVQEGLCKVVWVRMVDGVDGINLFVVWLAKVLKNSVRHRVKDVLVSARWCQLSCDPAVSSVLEFQVWWQINFASHVSPLVTFLCWLVPS